MASVLGIDAAWTEDNDSGIALIERIGATWRLRAAAPNIEGFARACGLETPAEAGVGFSVTCAERILGGRLPDLIAVDMPLSRKPITKRRAFGYRCVQPFWRGQMRDPLAVGGAAGESERSASQGLRG